MKRYCDECVYLDYYYDDSRGRVTERRCIEKSNMGNYHSPDDPLLTPEERNRINDCGCFQSERRNTEERRSRNSKTNQERLALTLERRRGEE